jgi:hypothetical protein
MALPPSSIEREIGLQTTARPGWTFWHGNPDAVAVHGTAYVVETNAGEILRCRAEVWTDDGRELTYFHRMDGQGVVEVNQFVLAIEKPEEAALPRYRR